MYVVATCLLCTVTCVYKVKKDYAEDAVSLYPEIFKGLSKLKGNYTIR